MRHTNSNVGGRYRPAQDQGGRTVQTLKVARKTLTTLSEKRTQVLDITKQVRDIVLGADIKEGFLLVNSLHTTCALFVNEFQGALAEDLKTMMERLVATAAATSTTTRGIPTASAATPPRICGRRCSAGAWRWGSAAASSRWAASNPSSSPSWTALGRGTSTSRSWGSSPRGTRRAPSAGPTGVVCSCPSSPDAVPA